MNKRLTLGVALSFAAMLIGGSAWAQTDASLFWRKDSLQVSEIVSPEAVQYSKVGHHGPAVENVASAFRLYFNDSGAIDTYSKSGAQMELARYGWYPSAAQQAEEGAGCDEYAVSKTIGLGGIALWDGTAEVPLTATEGRTARVGKTRKGAFCEIIAYGVEYMGGKVDVSMRIDVCDGSRIAQVTARELGGRKVQFVTGLNHHEGQSVLSDKGYMSAWGVHPPDVSKSPIPLGAAVFYKARQFGAPVDTGKVIRIISRPCKVLRTRIIASSTKEPASGELVTGVPALGSQEAFEAFVKRGR